MQSLHDRRQRLEGDIESRSEGASSSIANRVMDSSVAAEGVEPFSLGEDKEVLSCEGEANTIDPELLSEALGEIVAHRDALQSKGSRRDKPAVRGHRREVLWVSIEARDVSDLPRLAPSTIEVRVHSCPRSKVT